MVPWLWVGCDRDLAKLIPRIPLYVPSTSAYWADYRLAFPRTVYNDADSFNTVRRVRK